MDRRFPRIGLVSLLVAATQLFTLVFNGLLGWFPGALLGSGAWGMKFHLYPYLRQILGLPYKADSFWSDAGSLTGQEYAMVVLVLITGVIGYIAHANVRRSRGRRRRATKTSAQRWKRGLSE